MAFCKLADWQTKMESNPGGWSILVLKPWECGGRRWALACPLGIPREEASWELFCGLPELKVKVRREDCRWGRAAFPGMLQWLLGEEEGASLELLLPSCFSLNGEVFLSRPWRS